MFWVMSWIIFFIVCDVDFWDVQASRQFQGSLTAIMYAL